MDQYALEVVEVVPVSAVITDLAAEILMLKRRSQFLQSLLFLFDLAVICACWLLRITLDF